MWKGQIILILCVLYVTGSLEKALRSSNTDYDLRAESQRPSLNRWRSVTTTARPLLQQYWHSFVRHLPTLPPLSWNITNPIGNFFNTGAQHIIETPMTMHYVMKEHEKIKTKTTKRKPLRSKNRKELQSRNYLTTYDNTYKQMQLQPLGLDHNRVMHFYEPSSGQYYALQVESHPHYYNSVYGNQYNDQYSNQYNQHNDYNWHDDEYDGGSNEDESYYQDGGHNFEQGYDSEDIYDFEPDYDAGHSDYDNEFDEEHMEYDDGVGLEDDWGYNDEDIFSDRKLKEGADISDTIAGNRIKIQKHLLKPEKDARKYITKKKRRQRKKKEGNK